MGLVVPVGGFKYDVGIGYIALPSDLQRDDYIRDCYKNLHVSMRTEDGGFYNRVPIPPDILNFIEFPKTTKELGTCVLYNVDEQFQNTFITNWFTNRDEIGDGREGLFRFRRKYNDQFVEISGSGKEGSVNILVNGGGGKGAFRISVTDANKNAEAIIDIGGNLNVSTTGSTSFAQQKAFIVETTDGDDSARFTQSSTENNFYGKKLALNDGDNPMVLGNDLQKILRNFIAEVAKITVNGTPPANVIQLAAFANDLDFLSKEAFIKQ